METIKKFMSEIQSMEEENKKLKALEEFIFHIALKKLKKTKSITGVNFKNVSKYSVRQYSDFMVVEIFYYDQENEYQHEEIPLHLEEIEILGKVENCYTCKHVMIIEEGEFAGEGYGCAMGCCCLQPCKCCFYELDDEEDN